MRLDSSDFALEELGGVGFTDEIHQYACNGHDDGCEVENPTPGACISVATFAIEGDVPVERDGYIASIDRPDNETQIRLQCPGKEGKHATFGAKELFDACTSDDGRNGGDDTGDETADKDAGDVGRCCHWETEDAVEERRGDIQRPASEFVGVWGQH